MLKHSSKIMIDGESVIDDIKVARFLAVIDIDDPKNMSLSTRYINPELGKAYRDTVRADENAFEDYAYALQDKVLAAKSE